MNQPQCRVRLVFGPFEADAPAGELRKMGVRVPLSGQPLQILFVLLERAGDVVTREELRKQIWREGTFVDFEHSLNAAINKLRRTLEDSAEKPRYIETVPGRGYRFIGSIREESGKGPSARVLPSASKKTWLAAGAVMGGVFVACLVIWMAFQRRPARSELRVQQLTTNSAENPIWHAVISTDGKYVAYGDLAGIQVKLIATGESHLLPRPSALSAADLWSPAAWTADGTRILATSITSTAVTAWTVSVIGGATAVLRENALVESVSPDGSLIVFLTSGHMSSGENAINRRLLWNTEIWTMSPEGENARRVVLGDNLTYFGSVRWSPDGKRIAYQKFRRANYDSVDYTIETCDLNGGTRSILLLRQHYAAPSIDRSFPEDFCWLIDGRVVYAVREPAPNSRDSNLWAVAVDATNGNLQGQRKKITNLAGFHMEALSVTADGKKLLFESSTDQSYVLVGRLEAGKLKEPRRLTPDQRYNTPYAWTRDSKAVIFRSDRTGRFAIYKQALDQNVAELIPTGPGNPMYARISPDGVWLIYPNLPDAGVAGGYQLLRVRLAGGRPEVILNQFKNNGVRCPDRIGSRCVINEPSSDGKQQWVFSSFDPVSGTRYELFGIAWNPDTNWELSPDGFGIAIIRLDPQGSIEMRLLTGEIQSRIEVKGWPNPVSIDWAPDGKALFVSHPGLIESPSGPIGATVLRVDLQGNAQPLWETRGARYAYGIPSPDGKYLAIRGATTERNAWMIENF